MDDRGRTDDYTGLEADAFLERLKPKPRHVVRMLMAEYTQSEVARELGMTRQAIQAIVRRARADFEAYEKICA
jgi:DNA-directed RNA polymerase specialized sigma24 family protein